MSKRNSTTFIHFFCLLCFAGPVTGQTAFELMPTVGFGPGFCHYTIPPQSSDWFSLNKCNNYGYSSNLLDKIYNTPFGSQIGLLLKISPAGKKYEIITGITTGAVSIYDYGYILGHNDTITFIGGGGGVLAHTIRVPIYITYPIIIHKRDKTDTINGKVYTYHHKNKLSLIAGIALMYITTPPAYSNLIAFDSGVVLNKDTLRFSQTQSYENRFSLSIVGGIMWTLYSHRKGKELLSLSLYFEQGTLNLINADLYFYKNSNVTHRQIATRGSQLQFTVGLPINLTRKTQ